MPPRKQESSPDIDYQAEKSKDVRVDAGKGQGAHDRVDDRAECFPYDAGYGHENLLGQFVNRLQGEDLELLHSAGRLHLYGITHFFSEQRAADGRGSGDFSGGASASSVVTSS